MLPHKTYIGFTWQQIRN